MVLQTSNCLYIKSKYTILRPLKGEVEYELSTSKLSNSDSSSSGFLSSKCLFSLMVNDLIACTPRKFHSVYLYRACLFSEPFNFDE